MSCRLRAVHEAANEKDWSSGKENVKKIDLQPFYCCLDAVWPWPSFSISLYVYFL